VAPLSSEKKISHKTTKIFLTTFIFQNGGQLNLEEEVIVIDDDVPPPQPIADLPLRTSTPAPSSSSEDEESEESEEEEEDEGAWVDDWIVITDEEDDDDPDNGFGPGNGPGNAWGDRGDDGDDLLGGGSCHDGVHGAGTGDGGAVDADVTDANSDDDTILYFDAEEEEQFFDCFSSVRIYFVVLKILKFYYLGSS
jgi:hypothetical protein